MVISCELSTIIAAFHAGFDMLQATFVLFVLLPCQRALIRLPGKIVDAGLSCRSGRVDLERSYRDGTRGNVRSPWRKTGRRSVSADGRHPPQFARTSPILWSNNSMIRSICSPLMFSDGPTANQCGSNRVSKPFRRARRPISMPMGGSNCSLVDGSLTNSIPWNKPLPRMSPSQ